MSKTKKEIYFPFFLYILIRTLYDTHPHSRQSYSELNLPLEKRFHNSLLTCQIHNLALDKPLMVSHTLNIQCNKNKRIYF